MAYATRICTIWCVSDCRHKIPCTKQDGHPEAYHYGIDGENQSHEWRGWKGQGKCIVTLLDVEDENEEESE